MSTYGVHLNGCTDYDFVRTQILPEMVLQVSWVLHLVLMVLMVPMVVSVVQEAVMVTTLVVSALNQHLEETVVPVDKEQ